MKNTLKINKDVLKWAIDLSDKSKEDILKKFPKLDMWLAGKSEPTFTQLRKLSKFTQIPFGYFVLSEPFEEDIPLLKYRTIKNKIIFLFSIP